MLQYVNYRMRITILDGRTLVGTLMAFDRHLNLVSGGATVRVGSIVLGLGLELFGCAASCLM